MFIFRSFSLQHSETPFISCDERIIIVSSSSCEPLYGFRARGKRLSEIFLARVFFTDRESTGCQTFRVRYPAVGAFTLRPRKGKVREGGCAERNLCRAGSVAAHRHRRLRDRALSSVSTQPRCSAEAAERRLHLESRVAIPPRRAFLGILARYTLPTQPRAGSITREEARRLFLSTLHLLWKNHSGSSRFQSLRIPDSAVRAEISVTNDSADQEILCDILSNSFTRKFNISSSDLLTVCQDHTAVLCQDNRGATMFNLYQSLNKKDDSDGQRNRESEVTGHDRFCQHRTGHSSTRRRRRAVNRRTQSATELNARAMSTARGSLRRGRSVSTEDENESEDDKGHQLANKLDNLARLLFSRVSAARGYKDQGDVKNGRYTALNHGSKSVSEDGVEYMEMEKRSRDRALSICRDYIGKTPRFVLMKQLNNIGSRVDKYWFMVMDTSLKTDRLLTLVPLNRNCPLTACPSTKDILNNLFLALQHPYICPVFHVDFLEYEDQTYIVLVQPTNQGSLKDLIYGIERNCWNEDWIHKYAARGKVLKLPQVQRMGRQILEALVFLKERGFPTVTHLHSGNVVIQNGVARLAGLENTLLGFTSRIHPIVTSRLTHSTSIDIICFGHMLFEMCAGYELCTFRPSAVQLSDIEMYPQVVKFLELIFTESENRFTSIEELLIHDLFRNIDLREMRCAAVTVFRPTLTPSIMNLLDGIKRQDAGKGITSIDSENSVSLNSFDGSLLTQIYNELSQTAL